MKAVQYFREFHGVEWALVNLADNYIIVNHKEISAYIHETELVEKKFELLPEFITYLKKLSVCV